MAINFPDTPSVDDTHTVGNITWTYNGTSWDSGIAYVAGPSSEWLQEYNDQLTENASINLALTAETATLVNGDSFGIEYDTAEYQATELVASSLLASDVSASATTLTLTQINGVDDSWNALTMPVTINKWKSWAYGDGVYVVVSNAYTTTNISYSSNGTTWSTASSGLSADITYNQVIHDGTRFIAVGYDKVTLTAIAKTSTNGSTWTAVSGLPSTFNALQGIGFDGTTYVIVTNSVDSGTSYAATSTNLTSWTVRSLAGASGTQYNKVIYDGTYFVTFGEVVGSNNVAYSSDGITWSYDDVATDIRLRGITTDGNGMVAFTTFANSSGAVDGVYMYKTNDVSVGTYTKTTVSTETDAYMSDISYGGGAFVIPIYSNANYEVFVSADNGSTWTNPTMTNDYSWQWCDYVNDRFFMSTGSGTNTDQVVYGFPTLGGTADFTAGDEITLQDTSNIETMLITSVDSATQLTVPAITNAYTTANDATVYASYQNSPASQTTYDKRYQITANGATSVDFMAKDIEHQTAANVLGYASFGSTINYEAMTKGSTDIIDGTTSKTDFYLQTDTPSATVYTKTRTSGGTISKEYGAVTDELDLAVPGGIPDINGTSTLTGIYQETISAGDPVYSVAVAATADIPGESNWDTSITKLSAPSSLPTGRGYASTWNSDDSSVAIAHTSSPYITIYNRSGDTFTKLTNPSTLPTGGNPGAAAFSNDGVYLATGDANSPWIIIYKRSGDTFTKLTDPGTLPSNDVYDVAFSPDDTYLACASSASPYVLIYKRSGDTFTKLTDPSTLPGIFGRGVSWSPDGTYLFVTASVSPYLTIYKRSGDTFTSISPSAAPAGASYGPPSMDSTGVYLAMAMGVTPFIQIYKRSGDTFTKQSNPGTIPSGASYGGVHFNSGNFLAIGVSTTPYLYMYERSGDTFTKLSNPTTLPTKTVRSPRYSNLGVHVSLGMDSSPDGISFYKTTTDAGTPGADAYNAINKSSNLLSDAAITDVNALGYATVAGVVDDEEAITTIWELT